jgi:hypothetical protein
MRSGSMKCFDDCFNYNVIAGKVLALTESISKETQHK